jgi:hypothetical protein
VDWYGRLSPEIRLVGVVGVVVGLGGARAKFMPVADTVAWTLSMGDSMAVADARRRSRLSRKDGVM